MGLRAPWVLQKCRDAVRTVQTGAPPLFAQETTATAQAADLRVVEPEYHEDPARMFRVVVLQWDGSVHTSAAVRAERTAACRAGQFVATFAAENLH